MNQAITDAQLDASPIARIRQTLAQSFSISTYGPFIALLIACVFFATQSPRFLTGPNLSLVVQQVVVVGTLAIGQTLIILTSGIDLSVGSVMAISSIVMGKFAVDYGLPAPVAILAGVVCATVFGYLNGTLITRLKLPPFIVTLGMLNIAFALTHIYSQEQTIVNLPPLMTFLGTTFKIGQTAITYGTIVMLLMYLLTWFVLRETAVGRHIYALGNNPEAARLTGIQTQRLLLYVYTAAGVIFGIAALLLIGRVEVASPQAGQTDNLDSITAVVLGGTSLFGGRGNVLGSLVGALIIGIVRNGLQLMQVNALYQVLITGILVILAVTVDQLSRRKTR